MILVFGFTGFEKFNRFESNRKAFLNQPMPNELEEVLAYAVPGVELLLALLLLFSVTRWWGYLGSVLLLTVFITYVGLIWVGAFPRVPCNCAGIIDSMGWAAHFWMNLGLIGVGVVGMRLEHFDSAQCKNFKIGTLEDWNIGKLKRERGTNDDINS